MANYDINWEVGPIIQSYEIPSQIPEEEPPYTFTRTIEPGMFNATRVTRSQLVRIAQRLLVDDDVQTIVITKRAD